MAIAWGRFVSHSRSKGHSAVAAAAYRAGVNLTDERTGEIHDYQKRRNSVLHSEIITPENAPTWADDRAALWNANEQAETRKNSQVCRDYQMALPEELGLEEWRRIVSEFGAYIAEQHGVAVDIAIHKPDTHKGADERNFHAHFLITSRRLEPEGFTDKPRELDIKNPKEIDKRTGLAFGKTGGDILKEWRAAWSNLVNRELERAGHDTRIDMRSYKDRGIVREPQIHMGPDATHTERGGEQTRVGDYNREVQEKNAAEDTRRAARVAQIDNELDAQSDELVTAHKNERTQLARSHKAARAGLEQALAGAWAGGEYNRAQRFRTGLMGWLDKITGRYAKTMDENDLRREEQRRTHEKQRQALADAFRQNKTRMEERHRIERGELGGYRAMMEAEKQEILAMGLTHREQGNLTRLARDEITRITREIDDLQQGRTPERGEGTGRTLSL